MHPSLLGKLMLPSYFTMVVFGFLIAFILLRRWAERSNIDKRLMFDFVAWMAIWGILGARVLHILADGHFYDYINLCIDPQLVDWKIDKIECATLKGVWDAAALVCHPKEKDCFAFANLGAGGFAFYGGFIAAAIFAYFFIKRHNLPLRKLLDTASWLLMFGLAWGRIGCFLASCCFGCRTDSIAGVSFPPGSSASRYQWENGLLKTYRMDSLPVHPTQLYEAGGALLIAFLLFILQPKKRFDGQIFCAGVFLYAITRFFIEFLRRDERGNLFGLSTSQFLAIILLFFSLWLYKHFKHKKTG